MDRKFVMVPVEPSDEMLKAGAKAWLSDDLRRSSTLYRAMISAAPPVDAQPVAVPEACKALLREVMHNHRDKESPDYNACEDAQCMWCEEAAVFIAQPDAAPSPAPAAAAVSDEWNRAIESAARVCDSRELRAHTKSAAACYRLCAQGIRALTRPAPADASNAGDPTYTDDLELRYAEVCEERDHLRRALAQPAAYINDASEQAKLLPARLSMATRGG